MDLFPLLRVHAEEPRSGSLVFARHSAATAYRMK